MSEENGSNGGAADIVAVEVVTESVEAVDAAVVAGGVMSVAQRDSREQNQSSVRKGNARVEYLLFSKFEQNDRQSVGLAPLFSVLLQVK